MTVEAESLFGRNLSQINILLWIMRVCLPPPPPAEVSMQHYFTTHCMRFLEERGGHAKPAEHDGPAEHADTAENEESFAVYEKTTILPPIPDGARQPWKIPVGFNHFKILTGFAMVNGRSGYLSRVLIDNV